MVRKYWVWKTLVFNRISNYERENFMKAVICDIWKKIDLIFFNSKIIPSKI